VTRSSTGDSSSDDSDDDSMILGNIEVDLKAATESEEASSARTNERELSKGAEVVQEMASEEMKVINEARGLLAKLGVKMKSNEELEAEANEEVARMEDIKILMGTGYSSGAAEDDEVAQELEEAESLEAAADELLEDVQDMAAAESAAIDQAMGYLDMLKKKKP